MAAANASLGDLRTWTHYVVIETLCFFFFSLFFAVHYQHNLCYAFLNFCKGITKGWPDTSIQTLNEFFSIIDSKTVFFTPLRLLPLNAKCNQRPIACIALAPVLIGMYAFLCSFDLRFEILRAYLLTDWNNTDNQLFSL